MRALLFFVLGLAAILVFSGCSAIAVADKAYDKGKKVYQIGEKIHDGLEKAGAGAKKAQKVYLDLKSKTQEQ